MDTTHSSSHIRNFVIIAHIDHGKSTLADRFLQVTGTIETRRMRPQYLDQLDLERERGITIKMAPVRMTFESSSGVTYTYNLIDTPGHSDFSYEVSRALTAVEGAILLVDATKGIQAQTLSNLRMAQQAGLTIIGAVNKIDVLGHDVDAVVDSVAELLSVSSDAIFRISGKTGAGVEPLLEQIAIQIPPPKRLFAQEESSDLSHPSCLIFDSRYDDHKGILAFVRVFHGTITAGTDLTLISTHTFFKAKEVGIFTPELIKAEDLGNGTIGYIATALKDPGLVHIGDTVAGGALVASPLPGYREPTPVVFISFYPDQDTKFDDLYKGLMRLQLNDPALVFEPDHNEALGRGMKVGFLGQLHFEIVSERLQREFGLDFMTSFPSIAYRVIDAGINRIIKQTADWPTKPDAVYQPMIDLIILAPGRYLPHIIGLNSIFDILILETKTLGDAVVVSARMPLSELIRDFDDQLKSVTAGYASFSYELSGEERADVVKMEILVAGESQPALTRIVSRRDVEREARSTVERLKTLLPAVQFSQAIQAQVDGKIIARETIAAVKKELGNFGKNGGDRTRKMKLWKKQQEGKKRLKETGRVHVPISVFREILKKTK
jgi:GTP-binding protein LepA